MDNKKRFYAVLVKKSRRDRKVTVSMNETTGNIHITRDDMTFTLTFVNDEVIRMKLTSVNVMKIPLDNTSGEPQFSPYEHSYRINGKTDMTHLMNTVLTDVKTCPVRKNMVKLSKKMIKTFDSVERWNKIFLKNVIDMHL